MARCLVFVCAYREKYDSHKFCDKTADHQLAKQRKKKALSNDIAVATRPRFEGHISSFCLKLESIARGTLQYRFGYGTLGFRRTHFGKRCCACHVLGQL